MSPDKYASLVRLTDHPFPVWASRGAEQRGQVIAGRCRKAHRFLSQALEFEAEMRLLVLAPEHWQDHTGSPMFGVPQTIDPQTVVVAGQDAELWQMIIPPPEALPPSEAQRLRAVYGRPDGALDIALYMDWLPVHEIGHLFVDQAAGRFDFHLPRRWLVELFCNLGLHAYVASEAPEALPHLEAFPQAVISQDRASFRHQSWQDFEALYAGMEPPNFIWYLCRLHAAAQRIFEAGGMEALRRLHHTLARSRENPTDEQLAVLLRAAVHPEVAEVLAAE